MYINKVLDIYTNTTVLFLALATNVSEFLGCQPFDSDISANSNGTILMYFDCKYRMTVLMSQQQSDDSDDNDVQHLTVQADINKIQSIHMCQSTISYMTSCI